MHQHQSGHHHGHAHGALGTGAANRRRLAIVLMLAASYLLAEIVGGILSNSLALLADAAHMFSDVAALGLSLFAIWLADRPAPAHRTYGYYRVEILAALANGGLLIAMAVYIFSESYQRFRAPPQVQGPLMMGVAIGGLVVNLLGLAILHRGRHDSLNLHGAWLHVLSDALGSLGAIVAGILISVFGWRWADPLASAVIGVLIIYSSWRLVVESASVLMENAPRGVDVDQVRATMRAVPGVASVHDLHVWTITSGLDALSAHVVDDATVSHGQLLRSLREVLRTEFGIDHVTIQIEPRDFDDCHMTV